MPYTIFTLFPLQAETHLNRLRALEDIGRHRPVVSSASFGSGREGKYPVALRLRIALGLQAAQSTEFVYTVGPKYV